jgi:hypothetical protein
MECSVKNIRKKRSGAQPNPAIVSVFDAFREHKPEGLLFNMRGRYGSRFEDRIAGDVKADSCLFFPNLTNNSQ